MASRGKRPFFYLLALPAGKTNVGRWGGNGTTKGLEVGRGTSFFQKKSCTILAKKKEVETAAQGIRGRSKSEEGKKGEGGGLGLSVKGERSHWEKEP